MRIAETRTGGKPSGLAQVPDRPTRFESDHHSWAERARLGELGAVLSAGSYERTNLLLHSVGLFGARVALRAAGNNTGRPRALLIDFGCGTGRFVRYFGSRGYPVIGIDITAEMLAEARRLGIPPGSDVQLTDGISIPAADESADLIWVCGVLKYGLFPPGSACRGGSGVPQDDSFVPVYREIAKEMHRVLKPGGFVVNVEMHVDASPDVFTRDFEEVGFVTENVRVLRRTEGRIERLCQWRPWRQLPQKLVIAAGMASAALRFWLDDPRRPAPGFHDYLFVWLKPNRTRAPDHAKVDGR